MTPIPRRSAGLSHAAGFSASQSGENSSSTVAPLAVATGTAVRSLSPSPDAATHLTQWLRERYQFEHVLLTGRGAAAIYTFLTAINQPGTCVVVPSITCPAAIYPIVAAGYCPVFCDISPTDYNMNVSALDRLSGTYRVSALLAIHSFGHRLDTQALRGWCDQRNALLIEDICQFGGDADFEATGDAVITSFGHTKLLDAGTGGALLTRDISLHNAAAAIESQLAENPGNALAYRGAYYALLQSVESGAEKRTRFASLGVGYTDLFVHRLVEPAALGATVMARVPSLAGDIEKRRQRFSNYAEALAALPLQLPTIAGSSVPWRYTFCTHTSAQARRLTNSLRQAGLDASNWYRSLPQDWGRDPAEHPVAASFETTVINLWLSEGVEPNAHLHACRHITQFFEGYRPDD